jgi:P27 family predicted phage terminase small subunit
LSVTNTQPTALKILRGNPGKRPLPENEPEPEVVSVDVKPPSHLSPSAKKAWTRIAATLAKVRILTEGDLPVFEALCDNYARYWEAVRMVTKTGGEVIRNGPLSLIRNPWATTREKAFEQFTKLAAQFGMTPSARTKIQVTKAGDEDSVLNEFLKDVG